MLGLILTSKNYVLMANFSFWKQDYRLDEMNLKDLWKAFLLYPDIHIYLVLAGASAGLAWLWGVTPAQALWSCVAVFALYPMVWYLLHRFVLHGKFLYRNKYTAKAWKRIHFDHHRDPFDLKVLFGALHTTLPTLVLIAFPVGYAIGGIGGFGAAFAAGILMTVAYEFFHCIQHLGYEPKSKFIKKMKRLHLQHHFFNENVNYGITSFWPDSVFRTYKPSAKEIGGKSPTVFNLGYTGEEVRKYPWVAKLTPDLDPIRNAKEGVDRKKPKRAESLSPHSCQTQQKKRAG